MPTPRAIITASVGAKSAMSKTADAANTSAMASAIAANATISGIVIAASDPSTSSSTTTATATPMSSPATLRGLLGDLDRLAAELDLQPAGGPRLGGVDHALDVGLVELVGLAVEQDGRERDATVARDGARPGEWALHGGHVRQALDAAHHAGDLRVALGVGQAPVADGEDDLAGVPGLLWEALLEQVERALGLGPRQREVVDEPAAGSGGEGERRDDGGDPGGHDDAAAVIGKGGKAAHADDLRTLSAKMQSMQICVSMQPMLRSAVMGLRERKKEHTRRAIEDAAFRLFAERGFQATTVADIADAADVAPRTFFAYFPSKEDVLFADFDATFEALAARLRGRPPGESTFDALRDWITGLLPDLEADEDREAIRHRLCSEYESIAAHERHLMARFEAIIAESVATDLGDTPNDLRPRMIAAAAIAALMAMRPDDPGAEELPAQEKLQRLDEALEFLRGGVAVLAPGPVPQR